MRGEHDGEMRVPHPRQGNEDLRQWMLCLSGVRLEILLILSAGQARVGEMVTRLDLGYTDISHALGELRRLNCVTSERDGPGRVYRLSQIVTISRTPEGLLVRLALPRRRHVMLALPE